MKKKLIITIDNEEDNQWLADMKQTTENAKYLRRFQILCNKFDFKPVYLTTYNMAKNREFISMAQEELRYGRCEVGMHLHAWCTPPIYELNNVNNARSYLIEYPDEVMEEKFKALDALLKDTFGEIVSHRSGRWAMDERYFKLLKKYGYKCDCSVTPGIDWSKNLGATGLPGSNYRNYPTVPYSVDGVLEVPVTIQKLRYFDVAGLDSIKSIAKEISHIVRGKNTWFRPSIGTKYQMLKLIDWISKSDSRYIMFMIHSSELMPGGSPYYKDENAIEELYAVLNVVFSHMKNSYEGVTLKTFIADFKG